MPNSTSATEAVLQVLNKSNIPVVLIDRDYLPAPNRSGYDLIGIDNVQAGYRIARHLIDAGAQNIRFLTQPDYASTIRGRIQGVAQAVFDAGIEWRKSHIG
jgi:DNA-binding LacI/PurR family transcriptional regulator